MLPVVIVTCKLYFRSKH